MLIYRELEMTRAVKPRDALSRFFRTQTRWELLLMIAANNGAEEIGIWSYIDRLSTRTESPMTIYAFIRDRIDDGSLILNPGAKKSRKVLNLAPSLYAALQQFLTQRYISSASDISIAANDVHLGTDRYAEAHLETTTVAVLAKVDDNWTRQLSA